MQLLVLAYDSLRNDHADIGNIGKARKSCPCAHTLCNIKPLVDRKNIRYISNTKPKSEAKIRNQQNQKKNEMDETTRAETEIETQAHSGLTKKT